MKKAAYCACQASRLFDSMGGSVSISSFPKLALLKAYSSNRLRMPRACSTSLVLEQDNAPVTTITVSKHGGTELG